MNFKEYNLIYSSATDWHCSVVLIQTGYAIFITVHTLLTQFDIGSAKRIQWSTDPIEREKLSLYLTQRNMTAKKTFCLQMSIENWISIDKGLLFLRRSTVGKNGDSLHLHNWKLYCWRSTGVLMMSQKIKRHARGRIHIFLQAYWTSRLHLKD